jgi:flagellar hook-length control protein FliK
VRSAAAQVVAAHASAAAALTNDGRETKSSSTEASGASSGVTSGSAAGAVAAVPALHAAQAVAGQASVSGATAAMQPGASFDHIDSAAMPSVLSHSPQQLSVGVQDPGLGWVEVHAHTSGGQVAAVVATSSTAANAAVAAHLPDMRNYLTSQQVRVDHLTSQSFSSSQSSQHSSSQGGGGGSQREPSQGGRGYAAPARVSLPAVPGGIAETESLSYISIRV